jgi:hypothetical protein
VRRLAEVVRDVTGGWGKPAIREWEAAPCLATFRDQNPGGS